MKQWLIPKSIGDLSQLVVDRRVEIGLSVTAVSRLSGVGHAAISNLERGTEAARAANASTLQRVLEALHVSTSYLARQTASGVRDGCPLDAVADQVYQLRTSAGLTPTGLAQLLGGRATRGYVFSLEHRGKPRIEMLYRLGPALDRIPITILYQQVNFNDLHEAAKITNQHKH